MSTSNSPQGTTHTPTGLIAFDDDVMYSIVSTPLISCSSGAATVSPSTSADAPG